MTPEPVWVDLGLPSGLLWRSANLGAVVPQGAGYYFSWGNTQGHLKGEGYDFSQEVYNATAGAAISADLTLNEDAAHVILGGGARMPSSADLQELVTNCTAAETSVEGMQGILFTSNINGRSIFVPYTGSYDGTELRNFGVSGSLWSSSYYSSESAGRLYMYGSTINAESVFARRDGICIRPVKPA